MLRLMVLNHSAFWHWSINEYSRTRYFGKRPGNGDWHSGKICRHTLHTPLHLAFSSWLLTQKANV
jgi:hypothetical protein